MARKRDRLEKGILLAFISIAVLKYYSKTWDRNDLGQETILIEIGGQNRVFRLRNKVILRFLLLIFTILEIILYKVLYVLRK